MRGERREAFTYSTTEALSELDTQIRRLELETGQENVFVERFSRQIDIRELSKEVVDEFISSIHIHAPDRIEITLNYSDEYEKIAGLEKSAIV